MIEKKLKNMSIVELEQYYMEKGYEIENKHKEAMTKELNLLVKEKVVYYQKNIKVEDFIKEMKNLVNNKAQVCSYALKFYEDKTFNQIAEIYDNVDKKPNLIV